MCSLKTHGQIDLAHWDIPNDFFIIDAHLKKARASSEKASRLHRCGKQHEAIVQNKLTRVFIHNALTRLNRQCEAPGPGGHMQLPPQTTARGGSS
ncbi:hypothetical protein [Limnohabitans radicicola]|uniref:Uncharacterized protein n=1 Tax=Limnohabitans radicicola TaxID=2771427 RepID=A0A927FFR5_9BURK|nr:hypothetical protein [Limnohabitans radicicola]MBD8050579.1 hypothetical protein [Limnohabitans radicicola]